MLFLNKDSSVIWKYYYGDKTPFSYASMYSSISPYESEIIDVPLDYLFKHPYSWDTSEDSIENTLRLDTLEYKTKKMKCYYIYCDTNAPPIYRLEKPDDVQPKDNNLIQKLDPLYAEKDAVPGTEELPFNRIDYALAHATCLADKVCNAIFCIKLKGTLVLSSDEEFFRFSNATPPMSPDYSIGRHVYITQWGESPVNVHYNGYEKYTLDFYFSLYKINLISKEDLSIGYRDIYHKDLFETVLGFLESNIKISVNSKRSYYTGTSVDISYKSSIEFYIKGISKFTFDFNFYSMYVFNSHISLYVDNCYPILEVTSLVFRDSTLLEKIDVPELVIRDLPSNYSPPYEYGDQSSSPLNNIRCIVNSSILFEGSPYSCITGSSFFVYPVFVENSYIGVNTGALIDNRKYPLPSKGYYRVVFLSDSFDIVQYLSRDRGVYNSTIYYNSGCAESVIGLDMDYGTNTYVENNTITVEVNASSNCSSSTDIIGIDKTRIKPEGNTIQIRSHIAANTTTEHFSYGSISYDYYLYNKHYTKCMAIRGYSDYNTSSFDVSFDKSSFKDYQWYFRTCKSISPVNDCEGCYGYSEFLSPDGDYSVSSTCE